MKVERSKTSFWMTKLFLSLFLFLFFFSCNNSFQLEKRKYMKGYYLNILSNKKAANDKIEKKQNSDSSALYRVASIVNMSEGIPENTKPKINFASALKKEHLNSLKEREYKDNKRFELHPISYKKPEDIRKKVIEKRKVSRSADVWLLSFSGFLGLITFGMFRRKNISRMSKLSRWASDNTWKSRLVVIGIKFFLACSGLFVGKMVADMGMQVSEIAKSILLVCFPVIAFFYPAQKIQSSFYPTRKAIDMGLIACGFLLMVTAGNYASSGKSISPQADYMLKPLYYSNDIITIDSDKLSNDGKNNIGRIIGTVLSSLLFFLLIILAAYISCELSCAGQEGLSWIVLIGGTLGALFTWCALLITIWGLKKEKFGDVFLIILVFIVLIIITLIISAASIDSQGGIFLFMLLAIAAYIFLNYMLSKFKNENDRSKLN